MHDYREMKKLRGTQVSQTIDSPILIFDFWELPDAFLALAIILIFGVIFYSWGTMVFLLTLTLGIGPVIRRRNQRGIFLHWPYSNLSIHLPGLFNPKGNRRFSD